jgi:steroid delta-isomerase-like uncharacterized protein
MSEANKQILQRWFDEVWNQQNESAVDALLSSECLAHGLSHDSPLTGPEGFKTFHRSFCSIFPDLKVSVDDMVAEGDKVAARWTTTMTHLGDGLGFPASGKKASMEGSTIVIIRDGMIREGWNFMDMGGLIAKLQAE